jgi:hypothetical protein
MPIKNPKISLSTEMVQNFIVKLCKQGKLHVHDKNGKPIIPSSIDELEPMYKSPGTETYNKSYKKLYQIKSYKLKQKQRATATTNKNVSVRTTRVEQTTAKKLVVNLSSSMTCTIQDNGLITVDFK